MDRLYTMKEFLTKQECFELLNKFKSELVLSPAKVAGKQSVNNNIRKSSIAFIPSIDIIDEKLKQLLKSLIKMKGFEVTGLGPYQFTEYKVGEFYDWHTDSDKDEYKDRFCSIVIQLNDDYENGYLQLNDETTESTIQLEKGVGTMYIFYSNIRHRVLPVKSGIRYSLVNWISLKKIENFKNTLI